MRRRLRALAVLFVGVIAGPGMATASPVPVTGSLELLFGVSVLPPVVFQGTVDVTGGTLTVPAGLASTAGMFVPINVFPPGLITGIVVTVANAAGQFSIGGSGSICPGPLPSGRGACVAGGGFGGGMPLLGIIQVKGALAINVPLSVYGADGELVSVLPPPPTATPMLQSLVVQGAPWTTRTARVTTTAMGAMSADGGSGSGPLGAMSSTLTLVTPAHVNAYGLAQSPAFTRMSLHFVPEPGSLALFGSGLAGLALAARARRRRHAPRGHRRPPAPRCHPRLAS